jgi:hypothetical protein
MCLIQIFFFLVIWKHAISHAISTRWLANSNRVCSRLSYVIEALWMEGVWSWACHIQFKPSVHKAPSYGLRNCSGSPNWKSYYEWNVGGWNVNAWKMKGLIVHPIVWDHLCGIWKVPLVPNGYPLQTFFNDGLSLKNFLQDLGVDGGGDFIQLEVFQALPEGRATRSWGNIGAFRCARSQSTAKIFLAPDHTEDVHNTSVMRPFAS